MKLFERHEGLRKTAIIIHIITLVLAAPVMVFIIELASNQFPEELLISTTLVSVLVCFAIELILIGLIPHKSIGLILCYLLAMAFATVNFYCLELRDIPFMAMDILSAGTGLNVISQYDLTPSFRLVMALITGGVFCLLVGFTHGPFMQAVKKRFSYIKSLSIALFATSFMLVFLNFVGFSGAFDIVMNLWKPGITYGKYSAVASFVSYAQFSVPRKPEGYSAEKVAEILEDAAKEYDKKYPNTVKDGVKPTVIGIMDEAFSDISVLGDVKAPKEHLEYYYSLKNDPGTIMHGKSYASTYAGGTARSEFEWLTGYSMRVFANAQPYSQFNFPDIITYVRNFKEEGYDTTAMHPENATNYRRNTVYEDMGFDRFYSIDDFYGYERSDLIATRVSDWGDFKKMIDEDEKTDAPQFFHNVTMQNHGGYDNVVPGNRLVEVDSQYARYPEYRLFESLIYRTDNAIEKLLDYYRECDTPTIICFYGDHLPNLPETMINKLYPIDFENPDAGLENMEKRFKVPFFIWANYDIETNVPDYIRDGEDITSMNYLGLLTRAYAGLGLSDFDKYLLLLREKIPVVNESGYIAEDTWHSHNEDNEYKRMLDEYEMIQYAGMFDAEALETHFRSD